MFGCCVEEGSAADQVQCDRMLNIWVSLGDLTVMATFGNKLCRFCSYRVGVVLVRWLVGLAQWDQPVSLVT